MEENRIGAGGARGLPRRGFLARAAGIIAVPFALEDAAGPAGAQPRRAGPHHAAAPQDSWLARLGGKHGQIFDTPALRGGQPLQQVRNYLDAWRDAYGVPEGEIDAVVGAARSATGPSSCEEYQRKREMVDEAKRRILARRAGKAYVPADDASEQKLVVSRSAERQDEDQDEAAHGRSLGVAVEAELAAHLEGEVDGERAYAVLPLELPAPGMPGQPMYYVVPANAPNKDLAEKFVALATGPEVQAEGIVKRFNWYPGIDAEHVQSQLDEETWNKLFTDVTPEDLAMKGKPFPIAPYFDAILESYERNVTN